MYTSIVWLEVYHHGRGTNILDSFKNKFNGANLNPIQDRERGKGAKRLSPPVFLL